MTKSAQKHAFSIRSHTHTHRLLLQDSYVLECLKNIIDLLSSETYFKVSSRCPKSLTSILMYTVFSRIIIN